MENGFLQELAYLFDKYNVTMDLDLVHLNEYDSKAELTFKIGDRKDVLIAESKQGYKTIDSNHITSLRLKH